MEAVSNKRFIATYHLDGETADAISAVISTHDDSTIIESSLNMPSVDGGYLFDYTFSNSGYYKITINGSGDRVEYTSMIVIEDSSLDSIASKVNEIHDSVYGKDLAETSDVEVDKIGVDYRVKAVISDPFVTGSVVSRDFLVISGLTGEYSDVNGSYYKWGNRNFDSNTSGTAQSDSPMWINGNYAIYAVTDSPTSGFNGTVADTAYEWQICQSDVYYKLVDETETSISASNREFLSLDDVVFTGSGTSIQIESANVIETGSSYGSVFSSDEKIGDLVREIRDVHPNYHAIITDNITNSSIDITGIFSTGSDRDAVLKKLSEAVIATVNANPTITHGIDWSASPDNWVSTNQPIDVLYGGHLVIDNTNGVGSVGDPSFTGQKITTTFAINTPISGLTEEESAKLGAIKTTTDNLEFDSSGVLATMVKEDKRGWR